MTDLIERARAVMVKRTKGDWSPTIPAAAIGDNCIYEPNAKAACLAVNCFESALRVVEAAKRYAPMQMDHDHASDCGCCECEIVKSLVDFHAALAKELGDA